MNVWIFSFESEMGVRDGVWCGAVMKCLSQKLKIETTCFPPNRILLML